jgi:hypothetical protein
MDTEISFRFPQLEEAILDQVNAAWLEKQLQTVNEKLDALTVALAALSPAPVTVESAPVEPSKPAPLSKTKRPPRQAEAPKINGEAAESEEDLRARAAFEAKRVARTFGIGAVRAVIKKVTQQNILQVDDVSASHLSVLLTELQAT